MVEILEVVKNKYKLKEKEKEIIEKEIIKTYLNDKYPVNNPKAIINIGPAASGKTGLNTYARKEFIDNNVVIINGDEIKSFHPKKDEVAREYPEYYTRVIDQEASKWTNSIFNKVLKEGYNVIFEGTGRNTKILETIRTKMQKYEVKVRGIAVNELNCLISILERYEHQFNKKGWGRLVIKEHFYEEYNQMPKTIETIENYGMVNIEIYIRGNIPSQPIKIYDSVDKGKYLNVKTAILEGRKEDEKKSRENYEKKISKIRKLINRSKVTKVEKEILKKIEELYSKED